MNNQSIINQFNQFDENMDGEEEGKNQIFNSLENSLNNTKNNNCFVKLNQVKNKEKDMFYMSSQTNLDNNSKFDKNKKSEIKKSTNSPSSKSSSSSSSSSSSNSSSSNSNSNSNSKSSSSSTSKSKSKSDISINKKTNGYNIFVNTKNLDRDSENSTVLEFQDGHIKSNCIDSKSPYANSAYKILNESCSNIIKNTSMDKLNSIDSDNLNGFILGNSDDEFGNNNDSLDGNFVINGIDMVEIMRKQVDTSTDNSKSSKSSKSSDVTSTDDPRLLNPNLGIFGIFNKKSKIVDI
jgi:hypothetical protein